MGSLSRLLLAIFFSPELDIGRSRMFINPIDPKEYEPVKHTYGGGKPPVQDPVLDAPDPEDDDELTRVIDLYSGPVAHETAAVWRMYREGFSVPQICRTLGISKQQLQHELNLAIDDEKEAYRKGMEVYDGLDEHGNITKEVADEAPAKKIPVENVEKPWQGGTGGGMFGGFFGMY